MDTLLIIFWASFLCLIVSLITLTFPAIYLCEYIKKGSKRWQIFSLIIYLVGCIITIILYRFFKIRIYFLEIKIALMIIPAVACLLFSVFLYYPLTHFLVRKNLEDKDKMDELLTCMFKCSFSDKDGSVKALASLKSFMRENEEFVTQYGVLIYLSEYIEQAEYPLNNKPGESIIRCVLDRCNQVKHDIDNFSPVPFPNIGLILSFVFSTVLSIFLSMLTITP